MLIPPAGLPHIFVTLVRQSEALVADVATDGGHPEEDWLLRAAEVKQVINQTAFSRKFVENNLIFSQMCSHLDDLEVEPASKFE